MVRKGQQTKERILAQAAEVFNMRGYAGTSLSDLMEATGLEKGGIYNHFANKEELALLSFDHALATIERRFALVWRAGGIDALLGFVATFRDYVEHPPMAGGCPVLNTAIDSDDGHPVLRERARAFVARWQDHVCHAVRDGQQQGVIRATVAPDTLATLLIGGLEGALMLTKLERNPVHLQRMADHLTAYIEEQVRAPDA